MAKFTKNQTIRIDRTYFRVLNRKTSKGRTVYTVQRALSTADGLIRSWAAYEPETFQASILESSAAVVEI